MLLGGEPEQDSHMNCNINRRTFVYELKEGGKGGPRFPLKVVLTKFRIT